MDKNFFASFESHEDSACEVYDEIYVFIVVKVIQATTGW